MSGFRRKVFLCTYFFVLFIDFGENVTKTLGSAKFKYKYRLGLGYRKQTLLLGLISSETFLAPQRKSYAFNIILSCV